MTTRSQLAYRLKRFVRTRLRQKWTGKVSSEKDSWLRTSFVTRAALSLAASSASKMPAVPHDLFVMMVKMAARFPGSPMAQMTFR